MITVACVWVGDKYPIEYVTRLQAMVARHLRVPHRFVCYTDRIIDCAASRVPYVNVSRIGGPWPGWWSKMALFQTFARAGQKMIYFDLDTIILDDITPLANIAVKFGICQNFTKLSGATFGPCNYGSCCMVLAPEFGDDVFNAFKDHVTQYMQGPNAKYGDQWVVEQLAPDATYLQDMTPPGFFIGYRDIGPTKPTASVVVFAGSHTPDNCPYDWAKEAWRE